jgi:hypothetical protein
MAVLYDPGTGDIAHYHQVLQFDPKAKISKAHVEEPAKEMATRHGWDVSKLKTLHVDHSKLKKGASLAKGCCKTPILQIRSVESGIWWRKVGPWLL